MPSQAQHASVQSPEILGACVVVGVGRCLRGQFVISRYARPGRAIFGPEQIGVPGRALRIRACSRFAPIRPRNTTKKAATSRSIRERLSCCLDSEFLRDQRVTDIDPSALITQRSLVQIQPPQPTCRVQPPGGPPGGCRASCVRESRRGAARPASPHPAAAGLSGPHPGV
jgi:hypothetical protein